MDNKQQNNPLHGIKLAEIVEYLYNEYGWERLGKKIKINSFTKDPSVKSSLKFLRKTDWARKEVEDLYLWTLKKNAQRRSRNRPLQTKSNKKQVKKENDLDQEVKKEVERENNSEQFPTSSKPKKARKFGKRG